MSEEPIASTSTLPPLPTKGGEERQIAIRLTTRDNLYSIPSTKFLVPSSWRRFHLSELINKVLENSTPIPFDFLISTSLLRSSLGAYCASSGTSEEVVLDIEYLPSTLPPQLDNTLPCEDWVSDISIGFNGQILTASYASTLSVTSPFFPPTASNLSFIGHDLSVLSCCYVQHPTGSSSGRNWIASGGMDRVGRVWEYETIESQATELPTPTTLYTLSLHTAPISSVRSRSFPSQSYESIASPHLITAGWDGLIGIWDLTNGVNEGGEDGVIEGGERKKRRKKTPKGVAINKTPVSVLHNHTAKVSRAIFDASNPALAYSASWDHTVRTWDLTTAQETSCKQTDKVHLDLVQLATPNLLLTGSTDRLLNLFDIRTPSTSSDPSVFDEIPSGLSSIISLSLPGHTAPVSSVTAHPSSALMFASGSYDGTVRIWDARSPKQALFVLNMPPMEDGSAGNEKVLSVDWDGEKLVAGGEGKRVVSWRVSGSEGPVMTEKET